MNLKNSFLPNYFKIIGLIIFFISLILSAPDFVAGFEAAQNAQFEPPTTAPKADSASPSIFWGDVLLLVGMLIYAFAKEKIEDEFLARQRSEAFFWAFNLMLVIILGLILLGYRSLDVWFFPTMQLILFLLLFSVKKRIDFTTAYEK
jgi:hypothetical protein